MEKLAIALFGYGRMGKEIEKIAIERGHKIALIVDIDNAETITKADLEKVDVAIDFSLPTSVYENVLKCFDTNVPVIAGTTGWNEKLPEAKRICKERNQALFFASNFSIGVSIFSEINKKLAQLMSTLNGYDVTMQEIHHTKKLDQPSGTAITLAEQVLERVGRKVKWVNETSNDKADLFIESVREGNVPGTHTIRYSSAVDDIEIKHTAHNRQGLALGAVLASEWIVGKKGVFSMSDMLDLK